MTYEKSYKNKIKRRKYCLKNPDFIQVLDNKKSYYGGNQVWFDEKIAKDSACGTVAATNILAYLKKDINLVSENGMSINFQSRDKNNYSLAEYKLLMNEMYKYIYPINFSYSRGKSDLFYKTMKLFHLNEISFGVPTIARFSKGFLSFAHYYGVELERMVYPRNFLARWTSFGAADFIAKALENDKPVAILNTFNKNLKSLDYESIDGHKMQGDFDRHWIVITEMIVDKNSEKVFLSASSWGEKVKIDLDAIIKGGIFKKMVYFK